MRLIHQNVRMSLRIVNIDQQIVRLVAAWLKLLYWHSDAIESALSVGVFVVDSELVVFCIDAEVLYSGCTYYAVLVGD